jgi:APA family basic amino acid/polyamine antiporter
MSGPKQAGARPRRWGAGPGVAPRRVLSSRDGVILVVGLVLGAGIFRAPQLVAGGSSSGEMFLALWIAGGIVSLIGALCYAELGAAYPNAGGEYHFLTRAFGPGVGFLCAWSRMTVIQTGSIAILAFVAGDYVVVLLGQDNPSPRISAAVAAGVVAALTALNFTGLRQGYRAQYTLTALEVFGLITVCVAGLLIADPASRFPALPSPPTAAEGSGPGLAFIFVLLTFGGWSEAAYLSAEFRDSRRGVTRTLAWGLGIITLLYLLANAAYLRVLGLSGIAASPAVAADVMSRTVGPWGALAVSAAVILAALSSANGTMITGARSNYALGRDFSLFGFLGVWHEHKATPKRALLLQGAIALLLVGFGALARSGFEAMVAYTAPVFWLILLGTGASLLVLRQRDPATERPFRVPLYPLTPLLFCGIAGYMLHASVAYAGRGALLGLAVVLVGIPVLAFARSRTPSTAPLRPPVPRGTP